MIIAQICVYTVATSVRSVCTMWSYVCTICTVQTVFSMHCADSFAGSLNLLGIVVLVDTMETSMVDTKGYLNLTFCHSSAILQGQFNDRVCP